VARKGHSSIANTRLIIPGASQRRRLSQKSTRRGNPYAPYGGAAANSSACIGGVGTAKLMSPTATLLTFALLVKGYLEREFFRAPIKALLKHILLPAGVLCFVSFLASGTAAVDSWPMLAVAGTVWLLFANSVNYGGMVLWHERWLLREAFIPAWLLVAAAELVPTALFAIHLSLIHLALLASSFPRGGAAVQTLVAGGIAAASGLGVGILAARLTGFRPNFALVLPKLLLASLVLTPVFYRLSALDGLMGLWAMANPLSVATELGRAGISFEAAALPRYAISVACGLSGGILCWGLFTLRTRPTSAVEHV
jgi:ABC-type polysaccharide/polyol phosphate export permease